MYSRKVPGLFFCLYREPKPQKPQTASHHRPPIPSVENPNPKSHGLLGTDCPHVYSLASMQDCHALKLPTPTNNKKKCCCCLWGGSPACLQILTLTVPRNHYQKPNPRPQPPNHHIFYMSKKESIKNTFFGKKV